MVWDRNKYERAIAEEFDIFMKGAGMEPLLVPSVSPYAENYPAWNDD
jgi:hypothetical protein